MHRSRALIALTLTFALATGFPAPAAVAATRAELQQHRDNAAEARKKAAEADALARKLAGEVKSLDAEIEAFQKQADSFDPKIAQATKRTNKLRLEVAELRVETGRMQSEIESTQAELDTQRELLAERVNSTYRQGSWFYFDVLLGSQDIRDLITRTELVSRVMESNSDAAANLGHTRVTLAKSKAKLDRSLKSAAVKKREAQTVENELRDLQNSRQSAANQRESMQDRKADLMADSKKNAARLRALAEEEEAESSRIAAELSGSGSGQFGGIMAWPVPSSQRITSPFGWRIHPIFGSRRFHAGIDVGRSSAGGASLHGAALVATADGTVIFAGYRGGYGNTVMIDHGNGVVTLYAHQASGGIRVRTGQRVSRGDRIGTVGSTGNSTGAHLHFEVRVNGSPRNPMNYM
ncbi:MAG: peptidoglycan DD-metalloendopeptidase family protein [Coriobacteriia bacterium]|nr:peptidoglycan DD-metalloendopeptidase family protein [Coriobacteriia bacterium]